MISVPDVAVVNVEGETHYSQEDSQSGEDGHGHEEFLGEVAELLNHHGLISRGSRPWQHRGKQGER